MGGNSNDSPRKEVLAEGYPIPMAHPAMVPSGSSVEWRTGLFDVCADPDICCYGTFCTPCLYGANVRSLRELDGESSASCIPSCAALVCATTFTSALTVGCAGAATYAAVGGVSAAPAAAAGAARLAHNMGDIAANCVGGAITSSSRTRLRTKFGIQEHEMFPDVIQHVLCQPCAVCQEAREIRGHYADGAAYMAGTVTGAPEEQYMSAHPAEAHGTPVEYSPETKPNY